MQPFVGLLFSNPLVLSIVGVVLFMLVPSAVLSGKVGRAKLFAGVSFAIFLLLLAGSLLRLLMGSSSGTLLLTGLSVGLNGYMALIVYRQYIKRLFR